MPSSCTVGSTFIEINLGIWVRITGQDGSGPKSDEGDDCEDCSLHVASPSIGLQFFFIRDARFGHVPLQGRIGSSFMSSLLLPPHGSCITLATALRLVTPPVSR